MKSKTAWVPAFLYFIGLIKISSKELSEPGKITLYNAQRRALDEIIEGLENGQHFFVCLKARQLGISTVLLALDIFWLYMHPGIQGALIFDTGENREQARQTITEMLESLPPKYRIPIRKHDRNMLVLANGSRLQYMNAGKGKNSGLGRSRALNYVHASETSGWGDQKGVDSLVRALSETNPNRLYIFESTALGFNVFYDLFQKAKEMPDQRAFFIGWWAKDTYRYEKGSKEYAHWWESDPQFSDEEAEKVNTVKTVYGVDVTSEQVAWYRAQQYDASDASLAEELPWCVSPDTRVGTTRGIIPIDQIKVGDVGSCGKVIAGGPTGTAPMFVMKTRSGYRVRGTANHPIALHGGGFCDLSDAVGKTVVLQPPMTNSSTDPITVSWRRGPVSSSVVIDEKMALFLGLFMGDGSIQGKPNYLYCIACDKKDIDVVDAASLLIKDIFGLETWHQHLDDKGKGGVNVRGSSVMLHEVMNNLGLIEVRSSKTQRRVHVPEFIMRSPKPIIAQFLRGLFEADGFVSKDGNQIRFFSIYDEFIHDVQLLLLSFGITCRLRTVIKKTTAPNFKKCEYIGHDITLRRSEVMLFDAHIGFLGDRKQGRIAANRDKDSKHRYPLPIVMHDEVVSVESDGEGVAWNVSIEGSKLFDAGGVLTHNTEPEAWQASGSPFFSQKRLTDDMNFIEMNKIGFKGFRYELGDRFFSMKIHPCESIDGLDLRVWEEPKPGARYVIGVDSAYGRSSEADQSIVSVWRCYADMIVQVAEYATPEPETRQVAWVMAHLAGVYRDCMVNLEINGPGSEVMMNLKHLREQITFGDLVEPAQRLGQATCLDNARWFLWKKPDTQGHAYAYNFSTNFNSKAAAFNKLRDHYNTSRLVIRSRPLLDEMMTLKQDGDSIGASGRNKDDRVMGCALAVYAWDEWIRPLMTVEGRTFEKENAKDQARETAPDKPFVEHIVSNFFKEQAKARSDAQLRQLLGGNI